MDRALSVLEYVAQAPSPQTIPDVSAALGLNITTTYHLFNTLEACGYLARNADRTIRIGSRVGMLYRAMLSDLAIPRDLRPCVETLSSRVSESAYLTGWTDQAVIIQAVVEPPQALRVTGLYIGYRENEVYRASGKAVLAYLPPSERAPVIERNLAERPRDADYMTNDLPAELAAVAKHGYAVDDEEYTPGVCCVAAPYFNADGSISGSVAVSLPAFGFSQRRRELIEAVRATAKECSALLGYVGQEPSSAPAE
ncbi:IclR family transcriptional regulator [Actinomadura sp. B10D3]|uniref:IclR family transcriptional regulator n=1 Tax=Actinomadura sp. B10D3 TaxID=3153557 RepID=UPI00325D718B